MTRSPFLRLWPLQLLWVAVAVVAGDLIAEALAGRPTAVVAASWVLAGAGWFASLVAMLVPRTLGLTVARLVVPASVPVVGAALALVDAPSPVDFAGLGLAAAATVAAVTPWATDAFVDGSAYRPERRIALRTPPPLVALATATWAATVAGAVAGPLLLADGRWAIGAAAAVVGLPLAAAGGRAVHQLSRRWLVLVPAGLVIHDPLTMPEPQLFLRQTMVRLGPAEPGGSGEAPEGTEDLTAGATGLVMELALSEPVELLVRDGRGTTLRAVTGAWFSPARPGALLAEATRRRLPVG